MDTRVTIKELLEVTSSMQSVLRVYSKGGQEPLASDSQWVVSDEWVVAEREWVWEPAVTPQ
jgi:hypothetical protein